MEYLGCGWGCDVVKSMIAVVDCGLVVLYVFDVDVDVDVDVLMLYVRYVVLGLLVLVWLFWWGVLVLVWLVG